MREKPMTYRGTVRVSRWSSERETPQELFNELDNEFHFTLDAAASDKNHKCPRYYTKNDSAFSHDWHDEIVFINPPFDEKIISWVSESRASVESNQAKIVVMLLPVRTGRPWFQLFLNDGVPYIEKRFLSGRLIFEMNGKPIRNHKTGAKMNFQEDCMIVVFRRPLDVSA